MPISAYWIKNNVPVIVKFQTIYVKLVGLYYIPFLVLNKQHKINKIILDPTIQNNNHEITNKYQCTVHP